MYQVECNIETNWLKLLECDDTHFYGTDCRSLLDLNEVDLIDQIL